VIIMSKGSEVKKRNYLQELVEILKLREVITIVRSVNSARLVTNIEQFDDNSGNISAIDFVNNNRIRFNEILLVSWQRCNFMLFLQLANAIDYGIPVEDWDDLEQFFYYDKEFEGDYVTVAEHLHGVSLRLSVFPLPHTALQ